MSNTYVIARTRVPGLHCWPTPTDQREYLGQKHRHLFHVEVSVRSSLDNARSVEFHDLLATVQDAVTSGWPWLAAEGMYDFGDDSCELIALRIARSVRRLLALPASLPVMVSVFEDGENGAEVHTP